MSSVFADGDRVFYSIVEGDNRENGLGTYSTGSTSIVRDVAFESIESDIYSSPPAGFLYLNGASILTVTATPRGITTHFPQWKVRDATLNSDGYTAPPMQPLVGGILVYGFDPAVNQELGTTFVIGHDIVQGGFMYPQIRWSADSTDTGVVRWGIEYSVADRDTGAFTAIGSAIIEQSGSGTVNQHQTAIFDDVDKLTALLPDGVIQGRVYRDADHLNDTFTGNALLHTVSLQYLADHVGTPSKDPDYYLWS